MCGGHGELDRTHKALTALTEVSRNGCCEQGQVSHTAENPQALRARRNIGQLRRQLRDLLLLEDGDEDYESGVRIALIVAAAKGHAECVRLLLDAGADHNVTDQVRVPQCLIVLFVCLYFCSWCFVSSGGSCTRYFQFDFVVCRCFILILSCFCL